MTTRKCAEETEIRTVRLKFESGWCLSQPGTQNAGMQGSADRQTGGRHTSAGASGPPAARRREREARIGERMSNQRKSKESFIKDSGEAIRSTKQSRFHCSWDAHEVVSGGE